MADPEFEEPELHDAEPLWSRFDTARLRDPIVLRSIAGITVAMVLLVLPERSNRVFSRLIGSGLVLYSATSIWVFARTRPRRWLHLPTALAGIGIGIGLFLVLSPIVDMLTSYLAGKKQNDLVFEGPDGGPLRHSNWYPRHFKPAAVRAGLPRNTRFHDLRHTYAAFLIAEGAHPRAIMERMGHSTINVTLGTYGHLFPAIDAQLDDALAARFTSALSPHRSSVTELPEIRRT